MFQLLTYYYVHISIDSESQWGEARKEWIDEWRELVVRGREVNTTRIYKANILNIFQFHNHDWLGLNGMRGRDQSIDMDHSIEEYPEENISEESRD